MKKYFEDAEVINKVFNEGAPYGGEDYGAKAVDAAVAEIKKSGKNANKMSHDEVFEILERQFLKDYKDPDEAVKMTHKYIKSVYKKMGMKEITEATFTPEQEDALDHAISFINQKKDELSKREIRKELEKILSDFPDPAGVAADLIDDHM